MPRALVMSTTMVFSTLRPPEEAIVIVFLGPLLTWEFRSSEQYYVELELQLNLSLDRAIRCRYGLGCSNKRSHDTRSGYWYQCVLCVVYV